MSLVAELKRRNVFRVAAAYLAAGWLVTEVLTTLLPAFGAPDWASDAVIYVFALGFLPTVVFAWAYELTPEGLKQQVDADRDETLPQKRSRKLEYVTITIVVLGILFLAIFGSRPSTTPSVPQATAAPSVAVLPFLNMSNDPDNEYFSNGLTETLLHMLAQIPDLKVAARTSSFALKDKKLTIGEIAQVLDVTHVLEGSVQRSGERVRITAQLIRARDGFHVWSENYDRMLDDIFAIQDEIAGQVGGALSKSLLGDVARERRARINTDSADAYDLYLQALNERTTFSHWGLQAAEVLLKAALTVDPDFLAAKIELANVYLQQVDTGLLDEREAYPRVSAIVELVLSVRPGDVDARAVRVFVDTASRVRETSPEQMQDAIRNLEALIEEEPAHLQPRLLLTRLFQRLRRPERALTVLQDALPRDPLNPRILFELGSLHAMLGNREEARAALEQSLEIEPEQPNAYVRLATIRLQAGAAVDYLRYMLKAIEVDPTDHELPGVVALHLYRLNLVAEGDDFRNRVMAIAPSSEIAYRIELARGIATGDVTASVASARRAIEQDVDDRLAAFSSAVQHLLRVAAKRGTVEDEIGYLERHAPGIFDIGATSMPVKYRAAQFAAFDAWSTALPAEELLRRLEQLLAAATSFGIHPSDDAETHVAILALQGKAEEAIDVALEDIFGDSILVHLDWRRTLAQAQYANVLGDPRVQAALQRWATEEAAARRAVRAFLAGLQPTS